MRMHLAQFNIAKLRAAEDAPEIAEFIANLEPINALSDVAPGFVWRLKGDEDDPTALVQHDYGKHMVLNFSVWETREQLWEFTYRSPHLAVLQRRKEWFLRIAEPYMVLWWLPEGVIPTLAEGMRRLEHLRIHGPGPEAFTFRQPYESSEAASLPAAAEARK